MTKEIAMSEEEFKMQNALGLVDPKTYLDYVWKEHIKVYKKEMLDIRAKYAHKKSTRYGRWRNKRCNDKEIYNFVKKWKISFEEYCKKVVNNVTIRWEVIVPLTHRCTLSNGYAFELYLMELWYGNDYD
jgi:hypothetical protein